MLDIKQNQKDHRRGSLSILEPVDILEPIEKFSENLKGKEGVGEIFNVGLEDWSPAESKRLR